MHLIDVAQTVNGVARSDCFQEADAITRRVIGAHPSSTEVIAYGIVQAGAHFLIARWLENDDRLSPATRTVLRSIDLATKAYVIGSNHRIGMRPFGDNVCRWR